MLDNACVHTLAAHGLYIHSLPGRLRLELPSLAGNPTLARKLEKALTQSPGVKTASASPLTSRILVHYDSARVSPNQLVNLLHSVDCLPCCGGGHPQLEYKTAANGILGLAVEQVLTLGLQVALGI